MVFTPHSPLPLPYSQFSSQPSSHGHKTQNTEEDTCYTPTAQLEQLLTLKGENSTLLNEKNRLTENNNITEQRNKQLVEENDSLSKEIRGKSTERKE